MSSTPVSPEAQFDLKPVTELDLAGFWTANGSLIATSAVNVLWALVVLAGGAWLADVAGRIVKRAARRGARLDDTLANFFSQIARYAVFVFLAIAILQRFGIETTSIVAVLGAASLAIGLALQGTLSNVAAGVMLILFRPYRIGDVVEVAGKTGTIRNIRLFTTEMAFFDNVQVILPNSKCWGDLIVNYSLEDTRRLDLEFKVSRQQSVAEIEALLADLIAAEPRFMKDPMPFARLVEINDTANVFALRVWCPNAEYWPLRYDMLRRWADLVDDGKVRIAPTPATPPSL